MWCVLVVAAVVAAAAAAAEGRGWFVSRMLSGTWQCHGPSTTMFGLPCANERVKTACVLPAVQWPTRWSHFVAKRKFATRPHAPPLRPTPLLIGATLPQDRAVSYAPQISWVSPRRDGLWSSFLQLRPNKGGGGKGLGKDFFRLFPVPFFHKLLFCLSCLHNALCSVVVHTAALPVQP
eukprot:COSAG01_NODE_15492_length_1331_cov_1.354708_1_plen_178_part_00